MKNATDYARIMQRGEPERPYLGPPTLFLLGGFVFTSSERPAQIAARLTDGYGLRCACMTTETTVADWLHEQREAGELVNCRVDRDGEQPLHATYLMEIGPSGPIVDLQRARIGTYVEIEAIEGPVCANPPSEKKDDGAKPA